MPLHSFSVIIPSSNNPWRQHNCSKFFILKSAGFPGDIPENGTPDSGVSVGSVDTLEA